MGQHRFHANALVHPARLDLGAARPEASRRRPQDRHRVADGRADLLERHGRVEQHDLVDVVAPDPDALPHACHEIRERGAEVDVGLVAPQEPLEGRGGVGSPVEAAVRLQQVRRAELVEQVEQPSQDARLDRLVSQDRSVRERRVRARPRDHAVERPVVEGHELRRRPAGAQEHEVSRGACLRDRAPRALGSDPVVRQVRPVHVEEDHPALRHRPAPRRASASRHSIASGKGSGSAATGAPLILRADGRPVKTRPARPRAAALLRSRAVRRSVERDRAGQPPQPRGGTLMGLEDKMKNEGEDLKGKAKEATGKVTGDRQKEAEGKSDQAKSDLKDAGEKVKDAFDH
jgi:uncharacterized protein YjbJ (UPF0337 family)